MQKRKRKGNKQRKESNRLLNKVSLLVSLVLFSSPATARRKHKKNRKLGRNGKGRGKELAVWVQGVTQRDQHSNHMQEIPQKLME